MLDGVCDLVCVIILVVSVLAFYTLTIFVPLNT